MSDELNANQNQSKANTDGTGNGSGSQADQGNQGTPNPFLESLPEPLRGFEGFKDIGDLGTLAGKFVELASARPVIPGKPEEYEIQVPDGLPKDEAFLTGFRGAALAAKLTQEQVKTVTDWWHGTVSEVQAQGAKAQEEAVKTLQGEWKKDFDQNLATAQRALKQFGGEDLVNFLNQTGLGDNPILVKTFHAIGQAISEDSFLSGSAKPQTIKRTAGGEPMLSFPSMEK